MAQPESLRGGSKRRRSGDSGADGFVRVEGVRISAEMHVLKHHLGRKIDRR
jgi:hypothetical protein